VFAQGHDFGGAGVDDALLLLLAEFLDFALVDGDFGDLVVVARNAGDPLRVVFADGLARDALCDDAVVLLEFHDHDAPVFLVFPLDFLVEGGVGQTFVDEGFHVAKTADIVPYLLQLVCSDVLDVVVPLGHVRELVHIYFEFNVAVYAAVVASALLILVECFRVV